MRLPRPGAAAAPAEGGGGGTAAPPPSEPAADAAGQPGAPEDGVEPATGQPGAPEDGAEPPADAAPAASRPRPPWSVVVVALALAVLGVLGALAALLVDRSPATTGPGTRADALQAARERTVELTSYDHARLDEDFAEVLETATGEFAQEYRETTAGLRETFAQNQAVATATVRGAGIEVFAEDRAVVIVAVDQVIRTATAPPRTERNRLRMTLVRPDGTWLVSDVERL